MAANRRVDDVSSPFYLHPSDGPGLVLVSQLLSEDNFASWSRAMQISLTVKNKLGFINGTITEPSRDEAVLHNAWVRNNSIVISWILNAVSKDIQASIMYSDSAHEMWKDLNTRFSQTNGPRIFQLRRELSNLTQDTQSVNVYFTKLKAIWDELSNFRPSCTCGACTCGGVQKLNEHYNLEHVMAFLMGLNESLTSTRGQILLMDPLPPINKVFALVSQEERQRSIHSSHNEVQNSLAFSIRGDQSVQRSVHNQVYTSAPKRKERGFCTHCNIYGHTIDKCYKLHGYPPGYKAKPRYSSLPQSRFSVNQVAAMESPLDYATSGSTSQPPFVSSDPVLANMSAAQCQQLMAYFSNQMAAKKQVSTQQSHGDEAEVAHISCVSGICLAASLHESFQPHYWIIDSGASRHICNDKTLFSSLHKVNFARVILPDCSLVVVEYMGDVCLSDDLILKNVFYVPSFKFNLISVSALLDRLPHTVIFDSTSFLIQDKFLKKIGKGSKIDVSATVWHNRLGHIPQLKLDILSTKFSLAMDKPKNNSCCYICPMAKQKRLKFPISSTVSSHMFDLIHCDIWGPYRVESHNGYKYFVTLVDDYSRFTWVHLLKSKSDVLTAIPAFFHMVKTQFNCNIKMFRSDNAHELQFTQLFSQLGVLHQFSCVYTPQQNAVVERKHQHILNVARSLLFQSHMPITFWNECISTAVFLINRTPAAKLNNLSPFELLYPGKLFDYNSLKVFGCLVFASSLPAQRSKF
ncbi:PREDICTED: uncharacterized protein LOC105976150 [Erythranthe guttata]|uniref:uncharacterized protein LOC105976150 n=1 Tax=Erythranthe guttata TaxID=4155 RepID=UPI00064DBDFF|nr:PREDICTED: uncharacterized protein LOC105976150 [Erythranthe guttata]|eukprot:XP_012856897.1 PREDICTED: uncharacterized protein LOC105976150 [Erythranthe guttata]